MNGLLSKPAIEPILMTVPPVAIKSGANACVMASTAQKFTSKVRFAASMSTSSAGMRFCWPELLTR